MNPGPPALCPGTVFHRRRSPKEHAFSYEVFYVWFDPDDPESLTDRHWSWSTSRFRPVRIVADDYGVPNGEPVAAWIGRTLQETDPSLAVGEVRILTQPRRWGWLFNPISLYLVWPPHCNDHPTAAVLEVTNTPWKERHHYFTALENEMSGDGSEIVSVGATFSKELHVSPFLPSDMSYLLRITERPTPSEESGPALDIAISVSDAAGEIVLDTGMNLQRQPATGAAMADTLRRDGFPTLRTSLGIHHQAARLLTKGIPFVPHPKRSKNRGPARH